jgi:hypothetical protein
MDNLNIPAAAVPLVVLGHITYQPFLDGNITDPSIDGILPPYAK